MTSHILTAGWLAASWLSLVAVFGGALLARWRRHERNDAAETERVMQTLTSDTSHTHEMDAL